MSVKALQDYTFHSKYARYNPNIKRRDTWIEANDRVLNMHLDRYPEIADELRWAFDQVKQKRVLGSQRALQYGGQPILRKHARLYNCTVSYCDRIRFFQEALWLLLCGCGVGFSVQTHHIAKLPTFHKTRQAGLPRAAHKYFIKDSIEGWADSLGVLLATYFPHSEFPEWENRYVVFDYSLIREKGSNLSSGVGKAPGPEPLKKALEAIRELLEECLARGQTCLRTIDAYDIVMHSSDAVLSGGVRRSSAIAVFSPNDELMLKAKTGNWMYTNPQRARSNNSALLLRNSTTKEKFFSFINCVKEFGEPGFVWSDSTEMLFNPCVEVGMYPVCVETGLSGWQFCNLCEINGKKCKTKEDFAIAARAGAIIGTAQAGYTHFPYLGEVTERIVKREALLGVSITGMMENPDVLFDPETQREMGELVLRVNSELAPKIGINIAARATCLKPAGTTSCLLGTSSGVHYHKWPLYIRKVQANELETTYQFFASKNPRAVEKSVWSRNGTDAVISFCIQTHEKARTQKDGDALNLLEHVRLTQNNWVGSGKRLDKCTQPWLRHNVSNTIHIKPTEWEKVADYIYEHRQDFTGVSLLSETGDLDYQQAPFTAIHTPAEIVKMYGDGSLMASGLIVDGLYAFDQNLWVACDAASGVQELNKPLESDDSGKQLAYSMQLDWVRRAVQFADRYFNGDIRKMCYCLKEVSNWKLWCDLKRETIEVDYSELIEEQDNTKLQEAIACAGGKCDLVF
jgi:ribonucleoside-triphosphate reductase